MDWERVAFYGVAACASVVMWLARGPLLRWFAPDNFEKQGYIWLINQIAHWALSTVLFLVVSLIGFVIMGEYPYRAEIWLVCALLVLQFEMGVQRWSGEDTINDLSFLGIYGPAIGALGFEEQSVGSLGLDSNPVAVAVVVVIACVHLLHGVSKRI